MRRWLRGAPHLGLFATLSATASAHTLVTPYDLPIPFAVYVYACAATLVLTFAVLALVVNEFGAAARKGGRDVRLGPLVPGLGKLAAFAFLVLTIVAGLFGTESPIANVAPTLFWVGMMLGLTVFTALLGDFFRIINPWRSLLEVLHIGDRPIWRYPAAANYWPAFCWYLALEWLELMAPPRPSLLALALLGYTLATLAGAALFGRAAWFERAEFFAVFFALIGKLAPIAYGQRGGTWQARSRPALSGVLEESCPHSSLLLFVLFMLAATTYDGVWQTSFWAGLYWGNLMHWLHPLWGDDMARAQALLAPGYFVYQRGGLIAAPFLYYAVYLAIMAVMSALTGAATRTLAGRFAFTLIPIALAYTLAHNWTFLLMVVPVVPFLLTDPFGVGWNLLGLPLMSSEPAPLEMGQVWHIEVALILAGHVASVYLAHRVALTVFPSRRTAWISELPLLALMTGYTFVGLAVLSLPLAVH